MKCSNGVGGGGASGDGGRDAGGGGTTFCLTITSCVVGSVLISSSPLLKVKGSGMCGSGVPVYVVSSVVGRLRYWRLPKPHTPSGVASSHAQSARPLASTMVQRDKLQLGQTVTQNKNSFNFLFPRVLLDPLDPAPTKTHPQPRPSPQSETDLPARGRLAPPLARPRESGWLGISVSPRGLS